MKGSSRRLAVAVVALMAAARFDAAAALEPSRNDAYSHLRAPPSHRVILPAINSLTEAGSVYAAGSFGCGCLGGLYETMAYTISGIPTGVTAKVTFTTSGRGQSITGRKSGGPTGTFTLHQPYGGDSGFGVNVALLTMGSISEMPPDIVLEASFVVTQSDDSDEIGQTCSSPRALPVTYVKPMLETNLPTDSSTSGRSARFKRLDSTDQIYDLWWFGSVSQMLDEKNDPVYKTSMEVELKNFDISTQKPITWTISQNNLELKFRSSSSGITSIVTYLPTINLDTIHGSLTASPYVNVIATVNGVASDPLMITVKRPYMLNQTSYDCNKIFAFSKLVIFFDETSPGCVMSPSCRGFGCVQSYQILDQFGNMLPETIATNENFDPDIPDYTGENWHVTPNGGSHRQAATIADFMAADELESSTNLVPTPKWLDTSNNPPPSQKVMHHAQEWSVGSSVPGVGLPVQLDLQQMYIDHAEALCINTPPNLNEGDPIPVDPYCGG